jgi:diacylglycerol kinase (ATP)
MTEWVAITNPAAGHGRCGKRAGAFIDRLRIAGVEVREEWTTRPGHATNIARDAIQAGCLHFIAIGGDGTTNEVVNGIAEEDHLGTVVLATLPLGTGNSFLADFGLQDPDDALAAIIRCDAPACDLIRCRITNGDGQREYWCLNNIMAGFGADVGALMNRRLKFLGESGYTVGVLIELARLNPPMIEIELDGETFSRRMVMVNVGNSQYTGGNMRISPESIVDDGLLDLIIAENMSRAQLLTPFQRIFAGKHIGHPRITNLQGRRVRIASERPLPLLIDGDTIGTTPLEAEVVPGAIRMVR